MAWSASKPANDVKIRDIPSEVTANFSAIQTADSSFEPNAINLINRTTGSVSPATPAAITSPQEAYTVFSKDDTSGDNQLFGISAQGIVTQFTGTNYTVDAIGEIFLPGGLLLKWGNKSFSGTSTTLTVTYADEGLTDFPTATYVAFVNPVTSTGLGANHTNVISKTKEKINLKRAGGTGTVGDMTVYWVALGA